MAEEAYMHRALKCFLVATLLALVMSVAVGVIYKQDNESLKNRLIDDRREYEEYIDEHCICSDIP